MSSIRGRSDWGDYQSNEGNETMAEDSMQDVQFVEYVVKSIVDHPDDVQLERTIDEMGVLITLKVNAEDMGNVIGRSGQTAKAIRTLLRVVGAKNNARVNLKILEPEGGKRQPKREESTGSSEGDSAQMVDDLNI